MLNTSKGGKILKILMKLLILAKADQNRLLFLWKDTLQCSGFKKIHQKTPLAKLWEKYVLIKSTLATVWQVEIYFRFRPCVRYDRRRGEYTVDLSRLAILIVMMIKLSGKMFISRNKIIEFKYRGNTTYHKYKRHILQYY